MSALLNPQPLPGWQVKTYAIPKWLAEKQGMESFGLQ
jgi:hypothetical protein